MSYFKQLYARIKRSGLRFTKAKCSECGRWNGPIELTDKYYTFKCYNENCSKFGKPFRLRARKRGYR
jgi:hypothetical protein